MTNWRGVDSQTRTLHRHKYSVIGSLFLVGVFHQTPESSTAGTGPAGTVKALFTVLTFLTSTHHVLCLDCLSRYGILPSVPASEHGPHSRTFFLHAHPPRCRLPNHPSSSSESMVPKIENSTRFMYCIPRPIFHRHKKKFLVQDFRFDR